MAYPLTYLYLLASTLTFATTVAVVAAAPRQPVKRPIVICLTAIALWGLGNFLANLATTPETLGLLAFLFSPSWAFIPFLAVRIVVVFTGRAHTSLGHLLQWIFLLLCFIAEGLCLADMLVTTRIPAIENAGAFGHLPTPWRWLVDLTYVAATITCSTLLWRRGLVSDRERFVRHARLFSLVVLPATLFGLLTSGGQLWRFTHPPYLASVAAAFVACWVGVGVFRRSYFTPLAPIREAFHAAKARFEHFLHLSPDPLCVLDLDRQIVQANAPALATLGLTSLEASHAEARALTAFVHPDDLELMEQIYEKILAGEALRSLPVRMIRHDGVPLRLELSARGIIDPGGAPLGTLVAFRDVGPHRELETALRQSQRLESLGLLAAGIARDLASHLAAISTDLDAGRAAAEGDARTVSLLEHAQAGVDQAGELLLELETFAGTSAPRRVPVLLNTVITEVIDLLSATPTPGASLLKRLAPDLPLVLGDATRLRQVVLNLVTNAREACTGHDGKIELGTDCLELRGAQTADSVSGHPVPAGTYVRLRVTDNGCGIDPGLGTRIFEPFFSSKGKGRGLGLSTVLGIVREHGGYTRIATRPKAGTTLDLLFPVPEIPQP